MASDGVRFFVALDTADVEVALAWARAVSGAGAGLKLGLEFFAANGPAGVARVAALGAPLFLDLKLHDIPATVVGAVRGAAQLKPMLLTVHASGGRAMLEAAAAAAREAPQPRPLVLGVTVLTSLAEDDLAAVGQRGPVAEQVLRLAALSEACGLDGVVCSPREVAELRRRCGSDFRLVTPGVRPAWAVHDDQRRVATPAEAVLAGADHLVIGRPILAAADPAAAARRVADEIGAAWGRLAGAGA